MGEPLYVLRDAAEPRHSGFAYLRLVEEVELGRAMPSRGPGVYAHWVRRGDATQMSASRVVEVTALVVCVGPRGRRLVAEPA